MNRRIMPVTLAFLILVGTGRAEGIPTIPTPPPVFEKAVPESIDDLRAIQNHVKAVLKKVIPCTVGLRVGGAAGSGVIVSSDGLILTAAHVSGKPDVTVDVILPDGKVVKGKTLGLNRTIDSGMIKITEGGPYPYIDLGKSGDLKPGSWCIATGHPGGYRMGRSPVVRLGRLSTINDRLLISDCTLVGGDSGGPLFDVEGRLIGIHSRINGPVTSNVHVPVDTYRETWDRLVKGEAWGSGPGGSASTEAWLGVQQDPESTACKFGKITENSPAQKAGFKVGDIVTKFDGKVITTYRQMTDILQAKKPGDKVAVELKRGNEVINATVTIGRRPN